MSFYGYVNLSYFSTQISQHHKITLKFFKVLEISSSLVTVKTLRLTPKCHLGCIASRIYFPQLPKSSVFQASLIGSGLGRAPNAFIVMMNKKATVILLLVP